MFELPRTGYKEFAVSGKRNNIYLSVCVCACITLVYECVCVCVPVFTVVCVCVCVFDPTEARDVFIKQFTQLGASTHSLSVQLHGAGSTLDCRMSGEGQEEGEEEEDTGRRSVCRMLASSLSAVQAVQTQLQKATLDLGSMVWKHTHTHTHIHKVIPTTQTHTYKTHTYTHPTHMYSTNTHTKGL